MARTAKGRVRQAGEPRQARGVGFGQAFDGQQVEVGDCRVGPVIGGAVDAPLQGAAQVFQHADPARAETALAQQAGDGGRAVAVIAQHQQAYPAGQLGAECADRPRDHRERDHLLQRPAQARSRQGIGRREGQYLDFLCGQLPRQAGADAEQHGVTAGQDADCSTTLAQHRLQGKRAGPQLALATDAGWQQVQLALGADDL
jgi:hypothetical protein